MTPYLTSTHLRKGLCLIFSSNDLVDAGVYQRVGYLTSTHLRMGLVSDLQQHLLRELVQFTKPNLGLGLGSPSWWNQSWLYNPF